MCNLAHRQTWTLCLIYCVLGYLQGQQVDISVILQPFDSHIAPSHCIKSEPSEGDPFEKLPVTIHRQLTKTLGHYPTCTMYTIDSFYWDDCRINSKNISSIDLHASFAKNNITLIIDSLTISTFEIHYYGQDTRGSLGLFQGPDSTFDTYSHSFLIQSYLPGDFDTLLFEEVYNFLRYDTTMVKYDWKSNLHTKLDTNYFVSKLDTISTWTCYGENASHYEKVSIERRFHDRNNFGITLLIKVNYNDLQNSFRAEVDRIGIYKSEFDRTTGDFKYNFPFAQVRREDFLQFMSIRR